MHFQVENNNQNQIIQGLSPGQDQEQDISFPVHHKVPALAQIGAFLSEKKKINQAFAQSGKANRKYDITSSPDRDAILDPETRVLLLHYFATIPLPASDPELKKLRKFRIYELTRR